MNRILLILLYTAAAVWGDTIFFSNDLTLECDVVKVSKENITVRITKGTFTFPKGRITHIEYNYEKKKNSLAKDDFKGHYDLGVWCMDCDQANNALVQFLYTKGKKGVPDEVYLKIAELYMKKGETDKALAQYREYLSRNPNDALIINKIAELTKDEKAPAAQAPAAKTVKSDEGLEIMTGWRVEKWGNPGTITPLKTIQKKVENKILKIDYDVKKPKSGDKIAARLQYTTNLAAKKTCTFDVFNPEKQAISVALAFVTAPQYNWYESKVKVIKPGWNLNISFDLVAPDYKTKDTNWTFKSDIKNRKNTVQFIMLIYNGARKGSIIFDNIKFN